MSYINFFNASNQFRSQHLRYRPGLGAPMAGPSYSETTNITVKNGPSGIWGFASGLLGALTGNTGCYGGMGMSMGMCGYGMPAIPTFGVLNALQTQQTQQNQQPQEKSPLDTLKGLFPKYTIDTCPTDKNKLTVMKDGKFITEGTLDEVYEELKKINTGTIAEGDGAEIKDEKDNKEEIDPKYKNGLSAKDAAELKAGTEVTFKDEAEGGGQTITGFKIKTVGNEKTTEGYPKIYTFEREGKTITATFVKIDNGEAVYKAGDDEYRLEKIGDTIQFTQHKDDTLTGTGKVNTNIIK